MGTLGNMKIVQVRNPCRYSFLTWKMIAGYLMMLLFAVSRSLYRVTPPLSSAVAFSTSAVTSFLYLPKDSFIGFLYLLLFYLGSFKSHSGSYSSHYFLWFGHWLLMQMCCQLQTAWPKTLSLMALLGRRWRPSKSRSDMVCASTPQHLQGCSQYQS